MPTECRPWPLLLVLVLLAALVVRDRQEDARRGHGRLPRSAITEALADAIPGVGPARRMAVVRALADGDPDHLPALVRAILPSLIEGAYEESAGDW